MRPHGRDRGWVGPTWSRKSGLGAHHATAASFGLLKACIRIAFFACHGLLARALGDAVAMVDSHSVQVALILRESIQACPNDAKGATKAPQRSSIRCPVYTLGNGAGPCNPELPSPGSSTNSYPVYTLGTQQRWTSQNYKITITNNGVRKAVKVRYSVLREYDNE